MRTQFELSLVSNKHLKKALVTEYPTPCYPLVISVDKKKNLGYLRDKVRRAMCKDARVPSADLERFDRIVNTINDRDLVMFEILKRVELD